MVVVFPNRYVRLYLFSFAWFLGIWSLLNYITMPDTPAYVEMGRGAFEHGIFGYRLPDGGYHPNAFRMPLVPLILGLLHTWSGNEELTYFWYSLLQVFLAPAIPCLAYFWGSFANRRVAWGAFVFLQLHSNVVTMALTVLTDTLFAALTGVLFVQVWKLQAVRRPASLAFTGMLLGITCLVRPIIKLYWPVVLIWMIYSGNQFRRSALQFLLVMGVFTLIMTPWVVRNWNLYGAVVLETNEGLNLLWSNANLVRQDPDDDPERSRIKQHVMRNIESPMQFVNYNGLEYYLKNDYIVSTTLGSIAKEAYLKNPLKVAQTWIRNFLTMTTVQSHYEFLFKHATSRPVYQKLLNISGQQRLGRYMYHGVLELARIMEWCYLILAPVGLFMLFRRNRVLTVFIILNIMYFSGLTAFVAGYDRYRLNLEPFYAVLIMLPVMSVAGRTMDKAKSYLARK